MSTDQLDVHDHCLMCFDKYCTYSQKVSDADGSTTPACPVIGCQSGCGARFHTCKLADHVELCPNVILPCINERYGCCQKMPRRKQPAHLKSCPASVVLCQYEWQRTDTMPIEEGEDPPRVSPPFIIGARLRPYNVFDTRLCNLFLRRDEFIDHYQNVHLDVQAGFDNWYEKRCPLHVFGCTKSSIRRVPADGSTITYNNDMHCFSVIPQSDSASSQTSSNSDNDYLSNLYLPLQLLILEYLDSQSLWNLSLVSKGLRDLCYSVVQQRGIVRTEWSSQTVDGKSKWIPQKIWSFTAAFSPIKEWRFAEDTFNVSDHMSTCPYFVSQIEDYDGQEKIALPGLKARSSDVDAQSRNIQSECALSSSSIVDYT